MSDFLNKTLGRDQSRLSVWPWNSEVAELDHLIHPHWKTFPPPSRSITISLGIACLFLAILSYCGNATVIYMFSKVRRLRNPLGALTINLAVSDVCMMAILCPMFVVSNIHGNWIFGDAGCRFYGFSGALFGTASILTMTGVALDKYLAICKPRQTYRLGQFVLTPSRRVKLIITFVWLYSFTWAVIPLTGISSYVLEGFLTTCTFDYMDQSINSRIFICAMCVGAFAAPLTLIGVAYSCIVRKVHVYSRRMNSFSSGCVGIVDRTIPTSARREIRTAKATFTVVVFWAIAWTPYAIVAFMGVLGYESQLTPLVSMVPALFAKTAAVYNPFVYALRHKQYSTALKAEIMLRLNSNNSTVTSPGPSTSDDPMSVRSADSRSKGRASRQQSDI